MIQDREGEIRKRGLHDLVPLASPLKPCDVAEANLVLRLAPALSGQVPNASFFSAMNSMKRETVLGISPI